MIIFFSQLNKLQNKPITSFFLVFKMSIPISTATSEELLKLIGNPVEIDIAPISGNKSDTSVTGNIIAVDPETRSMILLQFQKGNSSHLIYIPGTSIQEVYDLVDGPFDDDNLQYVKNTPELKEMIEKQFRQQKEEEKFDDDEIEQRFESFEHFF